MTWYRTDLKLAPENVVVETVISDNDGVRNQQTLKRVKNLWFYPDGSMHVYYTPTHWREIVSNIEMPKATVLCHGCYDEFDFYKDFLNHRCTGEI